MSQKVQLLWQANTTRSNSASLQVCCGANLRCDRGFSSCQGPLLLGGVRAARDGSGVERGIHSLPGLNRGHRAGLNRGHRGLCW